MNRHIVNLVVADAELSRGGSEYKPVVDAETRVSEEGAGEVPRP
jgi:hypothetical protein